MLAIILVAVTWAAEPEPSRTVVFVCEHGSAKSVVAAAHFNRLAAERGLDLRAVSRGTVPDAELAVAAIAGLRQDGLVPGEPAPVKLRAADLEGAEKVIVFNELPPEYAGAPVEKWDVPPVSTEYSAARDAMVERIEDLLEKLAPEGSRAPGGEGPPR
jgi:protein-tyrosine-phosphatase